jgi:hypothetical protein
MIRTLLFFSLLTLFHSAIAQMPNEWINHQQEYYRIPVAKTGIYRLSADQLQQAGFPVNSVDPAHIQLFHRGVEQAIYVEGQNDGVFGPADFIRFYGVRNDGVRDAALYRNSADQPHQYYNLYSDTTSYFLTIGNSPGKRMAVFAESNPGSLSPVNYHLSESHLLITDDYAAGESFGDEVFNSEFSPGEGWTGYRIWSGQSRDVTLTNIVNPFTTGPLPEIEVVLTGRDSRLHNVEIYAGATPRLVAAVSFTAYATQIVKENIQWTDLGNDGTLRLQIRVSSGITNAVSVGSVKLRYASITDFSGAQERRFHTPSQISNKGYLEIQNAPPSASLYDVTSSGNVSVIETSGVNPLTAVFPSALDERQFFLSAVDNVPVKIVRTRFRSITPGTQDYIIITHPLLRKPVASYADPVKAFASYRHSNEGGGYDTLVVDIQQVYDQFNYGETSSLAIYNFMRFLSDPVPPKYLFIIGKGLEINHKFYRDPSSKNWNYKDLIPVGGFPGSDNIYSAGINGSQYAPAVPTGRLSAMYPKQVAAYLDKIKEHEAAPFDGLWRKKILHLSGGIEEGEPEYFRQILEGFADIAEGPYLGGQVNAIAKKSRDLEVINIADEVNKGLSMITFFGHSSPSTLDFDIGFVTNPVLDYHNKGRYPLLLMNGCQVGAFFLRDTLFGESWVYARDRGASAFIAHNAYGLVPALKRYSESFYKVAFADSSFITRGIGDIQREASRRYMEDAGPSILSLSQIQQMILLGDPAVKLFGAEKPDLEIRESQLSIQPFNATSVTSRADSFAIKMIVRNYGLARKDTMRIEVERLLPDNTTVYYDSLFQSPLNTDTLTFIIRKGKELAGGNNTFNIKIDADDIVDELNENNNAASYTLFIPGNGTSNLFPLNFAITNSRTVNLTFQSTDLYSDERSYLLEVDTVHTFDSPYAKRFEVEAKVLAEKSIELLEKDTLAYYWRTKIAEPLPGENTNWETSSFTFIEDGGEGWAQVHFPQLLDDPATGLVKDADSRRIYFEQTSTPVDIITYGASAGKTREDVSVKIKGAEYNLYTWFGGAWGCRNNTINLIAFDKRSASPYIGIFLKWYELGEKRFSCGREPFVINSFTHTEVSNGGFRDIIHYVNNITLGDTVVLFNIGNPNIALWPADAKTKLGELGISVTQLNDLTSGEPVVIFARKGSPAGTAKIYRSGAPTPATAQLVVNKTVSGAFDEGSLSSGLIGPSAEWQSLRYRATEVEADDSIRVDVIGVTVDRKEQLIVEGAMDDLDLSTVDPDQYPYLKLKFYSGDPALLSASQLDNWIVHYTPVPEGLLLPDHDNILLTKREGEPWALPFRFVNISSRDFSDSLSVKVDVFNQLTLDKKEMRFRIKGPGSGDTTHFAASSGTKGLAGLNDVSVYVNPRIHEEQYYENNIVQRSSFLEVQADQLQPVLDVTIDGNHIADGDYVSSAPAIKVEIWDDNDFLLKTDTSGIQLFLRYPCATENCNGSRIWLDRPDIVISTATLQSNFMISFTPATLAAGEYELLVNVSDASGNNAEPYEVRFVVSESRALEIVNPHPNPFSRNTTWGFTLTADDIPSYAIITIMDLTGKPVYERAIREGFAVGRNLFTWDGDDSRRNALNPGMYLYRIVVSDVLGNRTSNGKLMIVR